jgi:hypothetical protein
MGGVQWLRQFDSARLLSVPRRTAAHQEKISNASQSLHGDTLSAPNREPLCYSVQQQNQSAATDL